jgi:hypothetical protein
MAKEIRVGAKSRAVGPGYYRNPDWRPELPAAGNDFTMGDLVAFATEHSP